MFRHLDEVAGYRRYPLALFPFQMRALRRFAATRRITAYADSVALMTIVHEAMLRDAATSRFEGVLVHA